jgi:hypothetical protein
VIILLVQLAEYATPKFLNEKGFFFIATDIYETTHSNITTEVQVVFIYVPIYS